MLHINFIMYHGDINKSYVDDIISHVDIIYLTCSGDVVHVKKDKRYKETAASTD